MTKEQKQELFSSVCKRLNPSPWQQRVMWDVIDEIEAKVSNNWHTGLPTEEGDYLVKVDVEHNVYPYHILKWHKGGWYSHYNMDYPACPQHSVLKWQKIEED